MKFNKLFIILLCIFPANLFAQTNYNSKINIDSKIYKLVLDSLPTWVDFKAIGMPRVHTKYSDSIYNLLEKDSLYYISLGVRKKLFSEPNTQKPPTYKSCDTCRFVAYFYQRTYLLNPFDSVLYNKNTISKKINWINMGDSIINLTDFSTSRLSYIVLTSERINQSMPNNVHPMINGRPLYTQFGDYYVGYILMSNVIYSNDKKFAFLISLYNLNYSVETLLHFIDNEWVIERKEINEICCW